jgi:flagellar hook-associated protein 1 FlgK
MSLSVAYNTARSSLLASQSQMATVSRNITGASDPSYSRKIAALVTQGGAARVVTLRASDTALLSKMLETTSDAATQKALLEGLEKLSQTVGDTELDASLAARIGALDNALKQYANAPENQQYARAFVTAANEMALGLNRATAAVQAVRLEADGKIADSVARINDILAKFEKVNREVVSGTALGADVTDALDVRDGLIAELSEEIGVTVVPRAGNDIALYTDSGVPLFDKTPRTVKFDRTTVYAPNTIGKAVTIDGIQVTGAGALMPLNSGNLVGLMVVRDEVAVTYQRQLDELARGLIEAFAEEHQSDPSQPDQAGVFTDAGAVAIPTMTTSLGLAGRIEVTDEIDPAKSATGKFENIRDGGINGAAYRYNSNPDNTSFSSRLYGLLGEMAKDRPFASDLGLGNEVTLREFALGSASWVESSRQSADQSLDYQNTLLGHASEALSNATDVNVDDETALMLQLEKSYSASAKLISVIDQMLKILLNAVG